MKIEIQVNPQNPLQYLACCGIFEIISRFDQLVESYWNFTSETYFVIESTIYEKFLMNCLVNTFTDWENYWQTIPFKNEIVCIEINFRLDLQNEKKEINETKLCLDWWYEYLNFKGEIKEKSAWKMYAGQQTAEKITKDMVLTSCEILKKKKPVTISELINFNQGMSGRFGFDPRSSRNALDSGFSANDIGLETPTYPFAELLAVIGSQYFFPHRTLTSSGNLSTRGWIEKKISQNEVLEYFRYRLWHSPLPITLARMIAYGGIPTDHFNTTIMFSRRASRDKYSNLTMAT
ncbi:MAG: hypothetical protein AABZ60_04595 [Planctomycetota bacterium]